MYQPPFTVTPKIIDLISRISEKIGEINSLESDRQHINLRKENRISTIHSSLAIENNQLSLFQVEDVINGKPVIGEQKDIQEVKNAYEAYEQIDKVNPYSVDDLKKIHGILTFLIEKDAGKFRNHGEAVYDGDIQIFMAPPYKMVPTLIDNLFNWMNEVKNTINPLILSSIFHYEFVFIHPFHDGNGRTARIWQTAILSHWEKAFTYLPIESMIRKNQEEYYKAIQNCNNAGESTEFIEFMLKIIDDTIDELMNSKEMRDKAQLLLSDNEMKIIECIKRNVLIGAKEIIEETNIADRTVRRILKKLLDNNTIEMVGNSEKDPNKKYKIIE